MSVDLLKKMVTDRGFLVAQRDYSVIPEEDGYGVWMVKGADPYYAIVGDCLETLLNRAITENIDKFPGQRDPSLIPSSYRFFTDRLAYILDVMGWNLHELATACEIPEPIIGCYAKGTLVPPMEKVEGIADVLMISPAWLGFGLGPIHLEAQP